MKYILLLLVSSVVLACSSMEKKELSAQEIVDHAIASSGGELYDKTIIDFDFRGKHYKSVRNYGQYQYERMFTDTVGIIKDVLNNDGFERFINDTVATMTPDSMKVKYSASVNSVLYFALLPYGLNDAAVIKKHLGEVTIKSKEYYKIKVMFKEEGGGEDHEDVFVYWFDKTNYHMDYMAYSYKTDGGGARFRSAYNERVVDGIRLVDYINYKSKDPTMSIENFDLAYQDGNLKELSLIEIENIQVDFNQ